MPIVSQNITPCHNFLNNFPENQRSIEPTWENIPSELKAHDQWVLWRFKQIKGKLRKPPYSPIDGGPANHSDPKTWGTYEEARARYHQGEYDGVGFVFMATDPFVGVDLDHAIAKNANIAHWANEIIEQMDSYTEISPSKTGIHILARGSLPLGKRKGHSVEIYESNRFFTITGNHLKGTLTTLEERTAALAELHGKVFCTANGYQATDNSFSCSREDTNDIKLIEMAKSAKNGEKFSRLWDGDWRGAGYKSQSEADGALCSLLLYWTGRDITRAYHLFRQSGLMRDKWDKPHSGDGKTYGELTLEKALADLKEFRREISSLPLAPKAEPFPIEVLPKPLARFVREASAALPCPPDFIAVPMLAFLGTAIGTSRAIQIKPGWVEGPRINAAVVAPTGSKKSPALNLAAKPLQENQEKMKIEYKKAQEAYQRKLERFDVKMSVWKSAVRKASTGKKPPRVGMPKKPEEPVMAQVLTTDSTLEALTELLKQNSRGVIFVRDELTGWVRAMNQYRSGGKGADRQAWLSFWSGAQVVINRKGAKDPTVLNNPFVSVVGCLPPDVLSDLADERGREDGFIHRILFSYPDDLSLDWTDSSISQEAEEGYASIFERLWRLSPGADENGSEIPRVVTLTTKGRQAFVAWIRSHYKEQEDPLLPENLRGPWLKMEGYCARLALILHACRYIAGETKYKRVDARSVSGAVALVNYFKNHARRVYPLFRVTQKDRQVERALAWIKKQGGEVTAREIQRYNVAGVKTRPEAEGLLRALEERGYGKVKEGKKKTIVFKTVG